MAKKIARPSNWLRTPNSSNIAGFGWQDETLLVEFNWGGAYQYEGVPESVFQEMVNADSTGAYFTKHVKHSYEFKQVKV